MAARSPKVRPGWPAPRRWPGSLTCRTTRGRATPRTQISRRSATPTVYPWQAWPNIAAPYPYPEVPLDWRAVTLRWDDGIWWLDFKKNYTRPFFTPYPFGIFAY